jgi:hypothetical protein
MLSFPLNPSNGQQYTDPNGKVWEFDGIKWNVATAQSTKEFSGTKIYLIEPFFLNNTLTPVSFGGEEIDTANYFNPLTPTQIVIPRTGYYRIHMSIFTGQEGYGASYTIQLKRNNTNLLNTDMSAYQSGVYDEIILLDVGDIISVYASELDGIGTLEVNSFLEVSLQGYTFGGAIIPGFEFSGVKAELQSDISTTDTPTAVIWNSNDIIFNTNANAAGNLYWTGTNPTRFTVSTGGYYRIRTFFLTNIEGSSDSYTITIRKNGSAEVENITLGGNESAELDETYEFITNDYLEIVISNSEAIGAIKQNESFFQLIRLGV